MSFYKIFILLAKFDFLISLQTAFEILREVHVQAETKDLSSSSVLKNLAIILIPVTARNTTFVFLVARYWSHALVVSCTGKLKNKYTKKK